MKTTHPYPLKNFHLPIHETMEASIIAEEQAFYSEESRSLRSILNTLIAELVPALVHNKSFIVNEVGWDIQLVANEETITKILRELLKTIATCSGGGSIRITAKRYSNVILVQVRDENTINSYTVASNLENSRPIAEKIGGFLGVTSQRKNETVVVFSFPNLPAVA